MSNNKNGKKQDDHDDKADRDLYEKKYMFEGIDNAYNTIWISFIKPLASEMEKYDISLDVLNNFQMTNTHFVVPMRMKSASYQPFLWMLAPLNTINKIVRSNTLTISPKDGNIRLYINIEKVKTNIFNPRKRISNVAMRYIATLDERYKKQISRLRCCNSLEAYSSFYRVMKFLYTHAYTAFYRCKVTISESEPNSKNVHMIIIFNNISREIDIYMLSMLSSRKRGNVVPMFNTEEKSLALMLYYNTFTSNRALKRKLTDVLPTHNFTSFKPENPKPIKRIKIKRV